MSRPHGDPVPAALHAPADLSALRATDVIPRPLRVLLVVHDPDLHGAQRALLTLLQGLDRARYECHVVLPFNGPLVKEANALGHTVHLRPMMRWVPAAKRLRKVGTLRYVWRCLGGLRARASVMARLIERVDIDVVLTNSIACVEGAVAARMTGVPHVWHIHESIAGNPALRGILSANMYRAIVAALSDEVVFVSRSVARSYDTMRGRSSVVHPGTVLMAPKDRTQAQGLLIQRFGWESGTRLVGIVGSLQPGKDHATFLKAASLVHRRHADARFLIVGIGDAEYTLELGKQIRDLGLSECTKLTGWWPPELIPDLMAGLDVLVIASVQESFGLTAVEALAAGTPVVSTRCGGPEEVIRDGVDGRLVQVGDAQAMALAIEATLSDSSFMLRAQGRSSREHVEQHFSGERYVTEMQRLIERCAISPGVTRRNSRLRA